MVAADEPNAAQIGRDVLSAGGSAADAAVAMAFAMTVTLPSQVGFGAGGVCMAYEHDRSEIGALDFTAPDAGDAALPALPRGLYALQARFGKLRWEEVVSPAEALARQGFTISRAFARDLAPPAASLFKDESMRALYARPDNNPLGEGDTLTEPALGAALSRLRQQGVGQFYEGTWADQLVQAANAIGLSINAAQLRAVVPKWVDPVAVPYGDNIAYFMRRFGGGMIEAETWAYLARDQAWSRTAAPSRTALIAATLMRVAADQASYASRGASAPFMIDRQRLAGVMASKAALASAGRYDNPPASAVSGAGLTAMDSSGSVVTCAIGLNRTFGTGRILPGFGFPLAAGGADAENKLDLSPMMALNRHSNEFRFAASAGGGPSGTVGILQTALAAEIGNQPLARAIAMPRFYATPTFAIVEPGGPASQLGSTGLAVTEAGLAGLVNAVKCGSGTPDSQICQVAIDPRGAGLAYVVGRK
jgi:gamma-glutamyltranspeptidase/glutathione hydrolase